MTKVKGKGALEIKGIVIWDGTPPVLGLKKSQPEPASKLSDPMTSKTPGLYNDWLRSRKDSDNTDNDNYE